MGLPGRMMLGNAEGVAAAACLCAALGGCASVNSMLGGNSEAEALAALSWNYAKGAVVIEIAADPDLNIYDGRPHTMVLAVGQSTDPNAFLTLIGEPGQSSQALQAGKAPGMLGFERIVVTPGGRTVVNLDRVEGAKYVGVLAYYHDAKPPRNGRLFRIPTEVVSEGMVVKKRSARPQALGLRLRLGPTEFAAAQSFDPQPAAPGQPAPPAEQPSRNEGVISANAMLDAVNAARSAQRLVQ